MTYKRKNSGAVKIDRNGDSSEPTFNLTPDVPEQIFYIDPILDSESYFPKGVVKDSNSLYTNAANIGTGTGTITSVGTAVTGVGTLFTTELDIVGPSDKYIEVGGNQRKVHTVDSATTLTLERAFPSDITVGVAYTYGWAAIYLENPVLGQTQYWRISFSYSGKGVNVAEGVKVFLKNPISGFTRVLNTTLPESETAEDFVTVDVQTYADINSLQAPLGTGLGGYQLFVESTKQPITVVIKDVARLDAQY